MARSGIRLILAIQALWVCGCGTLISTKDPYKKMFGTYGGVKVDTRMCASTYPSVISLLCVADIPVSFLADTLLLPATLGKKDNTTGKGQAGSDQASQAAVIPSDRLPTPERQVGWVGLPSSMTTHGGTPIGP